MPTFPQIENVMEINRSSFRSMMYEAIRQREHYEKEVLAYTRDSCQLAVMRELLAKTESAESIIYLRD